VAAARPPSHAAVACLTVTAITGGWGPTSSVGRLPSADDRKKVKAILSQLQRHHEMTYAEAQDEFEKALPDYLKHDPVSPRKLLSLIRSLQIAIEDFDPSAIESAQKRAKAERKEIATAVDELIGSLGQFSHQLSGRPKSVRPD